MPAEVESRITMGPPVQTGGLLLTAAAAKLVTDPREYVCVVKGSPRR